LTCLARKRIKIKELKNSDFVLFEPDVQTRKTTDMIFRASNVTINTTAELNKIETIKSIVEINLGLAVVPDPSVAGEERNNLH
jgi:DNA-binding transcriptional LysR family regulator